MHASKPGRELASPQLQRSPQDRQHVTLLHRMCSRRACCMPTEHTRHELICECDVGIDVVSSSAAYATQNDTKQCVYSVFQPDALMIAHEAACERKAHFIEASN